jgi:predicted enzyme related to lactoylglutathione lyase
MKTKGIFLSWIMVKDMPKAIKFYTDVVGLTLKNYHKEYGWAEMSGPDGSTLGIGLEGDENPMKAGANAVVTVSVDDIEKAKKHFQDQGATLIGETMEVPGHVKLQTFCDNDGNTMQLVEEISE